MKKFLSLIMLINFFPALAQQELPEVYLPKGECSGKDCFDILKSGGNAAFEACMMILEKKCQGKDVVKPAEVLAKLVSNQGEWIPPRVKEGVKECLNAFGIGISDQNGLVISKGEVDKSCYLVGDKTSIFADNSGKKLLYASGALLDFVPVLLPSSNKYLDPENPFPFSVYNYYDTWTKYVDGYFNVSDTDFSDKNYCKTHRGSGHLRSSYFLGEGSGYSCQRVEDLMRSRAQSIRINKSVKTQYPLFRFSFFVPCKDGVYLMGAGEPQKLREIELDWLTAATEKNSEEFQRFFYNLAVIAAADPSFHFLEKPRLPDRGRAVVTGRADGRLYIAGIDAEGIYSPVDCGNAKETSDLIRILLQDGYESSPLKNICNRYMEGTGKRDVIRSFLPSSLSSPIINPVAAVKSARRAMNEKSPLSDVRVLIAKGDGQYEVSSGNGTSIRKVEWYKRVAAFNSKDLMWLAIMDDSLEAFADGNSAGIIGPHFADLFLYCDLKKEVVLLSNLPPETPASAIYYPKSMADYDAKKGKYLSNKIMIQIKCK